MYECNEFLHKPKCEKNMQTYKHFNNIIIMLVTYFMYEFEL